MSETWLDFFSKPKESDGFLCLAEIFGDEHEVMNVLLRLISSRKVELRKDNFLANDCQACFRIFAIEKNGINRSFLFFKICCGMRGVLTVEQIKAHLVGEFIIKE